MGSLDRTARNEPGAILLAHPPAFTCCVSFTVACDPNEMSCPLVYHHNCAKKMPPTCVAASGKCLGSGDPPGLQNRRSSFTVDGVFDSHALPPIQLMLALVY